MRNIEIGLGQSTNKSSRWSTFRANRQDETTSEKEIALERLAALRAESSAGLRISQGDGARGELVTMREEL